MALPAVKTLTECADFSRTVAPFFPQLSALPFQVWQSITDLEQLQEIYTSTNPLISGLALSLFLAPIFLVAGEINKNYSQVDRFWSLLPTIYNAHFTLYAHMVGMPTQRLDTLLAFSCIWSCRLTFNYWRKGGYTIGSEDYRWQVLREYLNPTLFFIFDVLFISLAQSLLLFSITTPTYVLLLTSKITGDVESTADLLFSRGLVGCVLMAFFADQQQWKFQNAKKEYQRTAKVPPKFEQSDLDRGFLVTGLWSWSRHPNFAAEQTTWVLLYQWSCYVTNTFYNWTIIGALCYLALFQASTWFTELITAKKYPEYAEYQQRVGKFLPRLSTDLPGNFSDKRAAAAKPEAKPVGGTKKKNTRDP